MNGNESQTDQQNDDRFNSHTCLLRFVAGPLAASAWNIPAHMLSAAITYQILQKERRESIDKVKAMLEKHPWYANQWQLLT
jgi:hypothetical protein